MAWLLTIYFVILKFKLTYMIPSIRFIADSFNRYNAEIFNSELPVPRFSLTKARTFRGKLIYCRRKRIAGMEEFSDFEIRLSTSFNLEQHEWEDVVIHEMIHYHIAYRRIKDRSTHGPVFRRIMSEINRQYGRHITVTAKSTEEQRDADRQVRAHYLFLARFADGTLGVAPVMRSHVHELWNEFDRFPNVVGVSRIATIDPWFNRFPRVKSLKLYRAQAEELSSHLKGALRLVRENIQGRNVVRAVSSHCSPDELLP